MMAILSEVRRAGRTLARAPLFTLAAIAMFGLGVGANIAVFSLFDGLMFRQLPYPANDRLVQVHMQTIHFPSGMSAAVVPLELCTLMADGSRSFDGVAWDAGWEDVTPPSPAELPLVLTAVTPNLLDVLGVRPIFGTDFDRDDRASAEVLITYDAWRSRFGGSPSVVQRQWRDGRSYRIVGVLPQGFIVPSSRFVPRIDGIMAANRPPMRGTAVVAPVGRLRPGVSVAAAQAEMDALVSTHTWENPSLRQHADQIRLTVLPLLSGIGILIRPYLWLILCAVWVVLGVTCANLSLMMLTRGQAARRDSAVSAALGASKARLMALIFAETMILCAAGAAVGWLMAAVTHGALVAVLPPTLQRFAVEPADARVVLAALAAACGACALAALTPMVALARTDLWPLLQSGTDSSKRLGPLRGGSVLLAVEAAMGVVVLAGAVQTVPGFVRLVADQGMEPEDLFTATINHDWVDADGRSVGTRTDRVHAVNQVVTALPNVERAAVTLISPLGESSVTKGFWDQRGQSGNEWAVDAGFFRAMATPIIAGRELSTNEIMERSRVAVLNQAGLKALWPNDRPTAVIARLVDAPGGQRQVIGIAADFRGLSGLPPGPAIFLPVTADEVPAVQSPLVVFLRMMHGTAPDSRLLAKQLDAVFPSNSVQTASVADQMAPAREKPMFLALLFGLLSSLAILLNAAGLLAVTRFEAGRRRREMAVRLVLGAVPWQVRARLLFSVMSPVAAGTVAGVALTLGALHGFQDVLPDGGRSDPSTCLLAAMFILVTAVLAVTRPLVSSGRMQPAVALRSA